MNERMLTADQLESIRVAQEEANKIKEMPAEEFHGLLQIEGVRSGLCLVSVGILDKEEFPFNPPDRILLDALDARLKNQGIDVRDRECWKKLYGVELV
ncbi:MAG: hypothetical protein WCV81_00555 [Microgenomates group bacterium]|jgi:hypothetical protein